MKTRRDRLEEEVRGYRVIYMKDHKDRNIVLNHGLLATVFSSPWLNAWRSIAKTLEFTSIEEAYETYVDICLMRKSAFYRKYQDNWHFW